MMDKYHIPKSLDEPLKFFLLSLDELIAFAVPFFTGLVGFDQPAIGLIVGGALVVGLKKAKGDQGHYFIYNVMYWHLPPLKIFKKTPASSFRELRG